MSGVVSSLEGLAANAGEQALAFGLGLALGSALSPAGVDLAQKAWSELPVRAPDAGTMAVGVAQGQVDPGKAADWAKQHGYDGDAFAALVNVANVGPALGYAFEAWRRGKLTDAEFTTALRRTGLEVQWDDAIKALKDARLDLGAIATAVHRGLLAGQGLIVTEPPAGSGRIPRPPQSPIDATEEAAAHGIDAERLRVLIGNTGLPLALGEMLRLLNMGEVTEDDVRVAVAESNIRNEYMDAALLLRRRLLTPHEYAEGELRGLQTRAQAAAGAALSGMEPDDYALLSQLLGRPLTVRAITTGEARGANLGGTYDDVPEPYRDAIRRSAIRPEYAALAYANRYTYPSPMFLRMLATAGALTRDELLDVFLKLGWEPTLSAKVADALTEAKKATGSTPTSKAQTQLWTATHKSYIVDELDDATATTKLKAAGVAPDEAPAVLALWQEERELVRLTLTPTQIKKAAAAGKFTRDEAIGYLERLGMTAADAGVLLDE